jgi:hypothetical protein
MTTEVRPELHFPDMAVELKRTMFVSADGALAGIRNLKPSFEMIDDWYAQDKDRYLKQLYRRTRTFVGSTGPLHYTHLPGRDEPLSDHLVVTLSPLNDGPPQSDADVMAAYVASDGKLSKSKAAPNSWGPLTKLAVGHELGEAQGLGAAHAQLYAPEIGALTNDERHRLRQGDPRPYGRLVHELIRHLNGNRGDQAGSAERYEHIHLVAAGMCGKAIGAAMFMLEQPGDDYELASVSLQNLSLGKRAVRTALDYMGRKTVPVDTPAVPDDYAVIPEPLIRRDIDGHGAEFWPLQKRIVVGGLYHFLRLGRTEHTYPQMQAHIEAMHAIIPMSITNAADESLVQDTRRILSHIDGIEWIDVYGKDGGKVGQMLNEHAAVMALTANRGISRYFQARA